MALHDVEEEKMASSQKKATSKKIWQQLKIHRPINIKTGNELKYNECDSTRAV